MQIVEGGTGANSFAPLAASRRQAKAGRGTVPRAGLHRSLQRTGSLAGASQWVTFSAVGPEDPADPREHAPREIEARATVTSRRIPFRGYSPATSAARGTHRMHTLAAWP